MENSIYKFLKQYNEKDIYPFHMPGHKRNGSFFDNELNFYSMDITEIEGSDNLRNPTGIIKNANEKIAKAYGAKESLMLVNGSSSGIISAIMSVCKDNDNILFARNSHISAYTGLVFSGANPIYIYPEITHYGIIGGIQPEKIKYEFEKKKDIKAVFITSPTYEGFCSDIEKIAEIVHSYNSILIVDEAHGAHFGFHDSFPKSAVSLGADIVIQSFHKTLPTLNQSSVLHICSDRVNSDIIKQFTSYMQTTSPSYILLATIENIINIINQSGNSLFNNYVSMLNKFRNDISNTKFIRLIGKEVLEYAVQSIDIGKLVFYINPNEKFTVNKIEKILFEKFKVQMEMYGFNYFVAMTSIADTQSGFDRLKNGIFYIDNIINDYNDLNFSVNKNKININKFNFLSEQFLNLRDITTKSILPRKAVNSQKKPNEIYNSIGKISAGFITPYPPGIPLVAPGEIISSEIVNIISNYLNNGIEVLGVKNMFVNIIND